MITLPYEHNTLTLDFRGGLFNLPGTGTHIWLTQLMGQSAMQGVYPYGFHQGIDLVHSNRNGVWIIAPEDGIVTRVVKGQPIAGTGFGDFIDLRGDSGLTHRLAHLEGILPHIKAGDRVERFERLGFEGRTGFQRPKGIRHLHWDITQRNRRYGSDELNRKDYINQFVDPLTLTLEGTNKYNMKIKELENRILELENELNGGELGTPENRGTRNEIYQWFLGRDIDNGGLEHWQGLRAFDIARGVWRSEESRKSIIYREYAQFLGRIPTEKEVVEWLKVKNPMSIITAIRNSDEAKRR
jgi:murein DD-endopeptidase MepM/ murein hydrolase activator NlpD